MKPSSRHPLHWNADCNSVKIETNGLNTSADIIPGQEADYVAEVDFAETTIFRLPPIM